MCTADTPGQSFSAAPDFARVSIASRIPCFVIRSSGFDSGFWFCHSGFSASPSAYPPLSAPANVFITRGL
jgi:hypothetical protein